MYIFFFLLVLITVLAHQLHQEWNKFQKDLSISTQFSNVVFIEHQFVTIFLLVD